MDEGTIPGWVAGKIAANKCRVCAVEDDMQINFYQGIQRGLEDRSVACMLPLMHDDIRKMRAIKDAEEIELMRHAQSITDAAFQHMLGFIKPGMTEKQVRNELENFMFANGADSLAFGSIDDASIAEADAAMIAAIASRIEAKPSSAFHETSTSGVKTKLSDPFTGGSQRMMHKPFSSCSKVDDNMSSNHLTK